VALKPTIYRFTIALSDTDRHHYDELTLTVALHPSETVERMMVRVLAFCLNANEGLTFTRGLSEQGEPDLWRHSLDGKILDWIEVGEPTADRLRKASRLSERVKVYSFNTKSDVWWSKTCTEISNLEINTYKLPWDQIQRLANLVERTMQMSVTVSDGSLFVATDRGEIDVTPTRLR
jgi:uncharacterized protein YaeQ